MSTIDPLGILKTDDFLDADGFTLLMPGEESRRSEDLPRYAETHAQIEFKTEDDLQRFLEVMEVTDRRLAAVTDDEIRARTGEPYDWQRISRKGLTVRFGVMWYDRDYFEKRKDAYLSSQHRSVLAQFNVEPGDLEIQHKIRS